MTGARRAVGLLGGSFNPAHGGHRAISLDVLKAMELDEVWWLVSPGNPLKESEGMAPLSVRYASAVRAAKRSRIRATAIETEFGTNYTFYTLKRIQRRYPHIRFLWIMGQDNLRQFHKWKQWRDIARIMPIAVVARPGYDESVHGIVAMTWLRRFVRAARQRKSWTQWRTPALVQLRFRPDPRSATIFRRANPNWHSLAVASHMRDAVTHRAIPEKE